MKQIKFTANGCCTWLGNFEAGDIARVSDEAAAHLVDEARCAVYVGGTENEAEPAHDTPPAKTKRKGR